MTETDTSKTVFISYRRSNTKELALALFKELKLRGFDVFWDIEGMGAGDFSEIILTQIEAREHFIVLLAHGTLDRCFEPGDWLRGEIEFAIEKKRNVIPLLYEDFTLEAAQKYLTDGLSELPKYQALRLVFEYFDAGVERLCDKYLSRRASGKVVPAPEQTKVAVEKIVEEAINKPVPTRSQLTAEGWFLRAYSKLETLDLDAAIEGFSEAIHYDTQYTLAYHSRGRAHQQRGDLDAAISDYTEALHLNPKLADAYYNRGVVYYLRTDLDAAISDYTEALRLDPDLEKAWYGLKAAQRRKDDLERQHN